MTQWAEAAFSTSRRREPASAVSNWQESSYATAQADEDPELRQARRRALPNCINKLSERDQRLIQAAYTHEQTIQALVSEIGRSAWADKTG